MGDARQGCRTKGESAMHRTFTTSSARKQTYLEGVWGFVADPQDVGLNQNWYSTYPQESVPMWVPGVWNTSRAYLNYEGVGWFRRKFALGHCPAAVLHFAAVAHQANVWLDGEPLGEHYGGFLPFSFLLLEPEAGEHELVVRVDNTHDAVSTIPSTHLDWFRYGGITRPVWVEELNGPGYVASLRLTPHVYDNQCALDVHAELVNVTEANVEETWTLYIGDQPVKSGTVRLEPEDAQAIALTTNVDHARLWSPEDPQLYTVRMVFGGDDLIERMGFRDLMVSGRQILLNGKPLRILGVNRHEDHPDWGFALPQHLMMCDMEVLQGLGANSVRGAHYPNDQRMLDLCDERGILFMEEIPLYSYSQAQLALDIIADRAAAMMWGMVQRDVNHPCIWAWSVLNECATDTDEGRAVVERLVETVREADTTRPVTFASFKNLNDNCFDLVDIVCVNAYYGWYVHDLTWSEFLDRMRAKIGDKPLLVTEFGAGALYGYHALEEDVVWSVEYQRKLLVDCVTHFIARSDLVGFYVWQFVDVRTDGGALTLIRPRGYNNKGLLDEYRRPKMAYYALRDLFAEARSQA
jgi:beta-glucuronidase